MTCRGNWICFDCRVSTRRDTWQDVTHYNPETIGMVGDVKCSSCGNLMRFIGPSIKVPPKRKIKEWQQLQDKIFNFRHELFRQKRLVMVAERHEAERELKKLKSRPFNKERNKLIKAYERNLGKNT